MLCMTIMIRMTVRDIRLKWPYAEKQLAAAGEIVVTRDSVPVARILLYKSPRNVRRRRFDAAAQARWLRRFWKSRPHQVSTDDLLRQDRSECRATHTSVEG